MDHVPFRIAAIGVVLLSSMASLAAGESPAPAAAPLVERLTDEDGSTRNVAFKEFDALPETARAELLPALMVRLGDPRRGYEAGYAISRIGTAAVGPLVEATRAEDPSLRYGAQGTLGMLGSKAAAALPSIVAGLHDSEWTVRAGAAGALSALGEAAAPAVAELSAALRDRQGEVRTAAARALEALGPVAAPAVGDIIDVLRDQNAKGKLLRERDDESSRHARRAQNDVRWPLVRALGAIGPAAATAIPTLLETLEQTEPEAYVDRHVRQSAVETLGKIRASPERVAPALAALLGEGRLEGAPGSALVAYGDDAIPALRSTLEGANAFERARAAETLRRIGTSSALAAAAGFDEKEKARLERERAEEATRPRTNDEVIAAIPATSDLPFALDDVKVFPLDLGGGEQILMTVHGRKSGDQERYQVLTLWRRQGEAYRRLVRENEGTLQGAYRARVSRLGDRDVLHVVRTELDTDHSWRLDRIWLVTADGLRPLPFDRRTSGSCSWLPQIGMEESLGFVLEPGDGEMRFGIRTPFFWNDDPPPVRWRGTLQIADDPDRRPRLVVATCNDRDDPLTP